MGRTIENRRYNCISMVKIDASMISITWSLRFDEKIFQDL